jgi:hypothetical protein
VTRSERSGAPCWPQEREPAGDRTQHVGKESAPLAVSLVDHDLDATELSHSVGIDSIASADDKYVSIRADWMLWVMQDVVLVGVGNGADAIYAPLPNRAVDSAQRRDLCADCIWRGA